MFYEDELDYIQQLDENLKEKPSDTRIVYYAS